MKNTMKKALILTIILFITACNTTDKDFDAAGYFEADETIVSAEQVGTILEMNIQEGQQIAQGAIVAQINVEAQELQKEQILAKQSALEQKTVTSNSQVSVAKSQLAAQQAQLNHLLQEKNRTQNLVKADAAPRKQLDDINAQITQMYKQMQVTREQIQLYESNTNDQNKSILSEKEPLQKSAAQVQYQIDQGKVVNPITGTVLTKYAEKGEMAVMGKPLYKISNLDEVYLKAYVSGEQLPQVKLNQQITVRVDNGEGYKNYIGTITWISSEAEFTPKTIQTKKERANLVYAIKIKVKNDGYLKLGMYGEVIFKNRN